MLKAYLCFGFILLMANFSYAEVDRPWGNCLEADVWILADHSGSMKGHEPSIKELVMQITKSIMWRNAHTRVGYVAFSKRYNKNNELQYQEVIQQPISEQSKLINRIDQTELTALGFEDMFETLKAVDRMQKDLDQRTKMISLHKRKIIILLSDGNQYMPFSAFKFAKDMKEKHNWEIFSVFLDTQSPSESQQEVPFGYNVLKTISGNAQKNAYFVGSWHLNALAEYFSEITCS